MTTHADIGASPSSPDQAVRPGSGKERGGRLKALLKFPPPLDRATRDKLGGAEPDEAQVSEFLAMLEPRELETLNLVNERLAALLLGVANAPASRRPALYRLARERAVRLGVDPASVPETFEAAFLREAIDQVLRLELLLNGERLARRGQGAEAAEDVAGGAQSAGQAEAADAPTLAGLKLVAEKEGISMDQALRQAFAGQASPADRLLGNDR